jgi:CheY-like chemotaxis protein
MRALVADDNPVFRDVAAAQLRMLGFEVATARDGEDAMTAIGEQGQFDLMIIDWQMGPPDGEELIRRVRTLPRTHEICICLWTATPTQERREVAIRCGANAVLPKPVGLRELATHLALLGLRPLNG